MNPEWTRSKHNPDVEHMKFADGMITVVCIDRLNHRDASCFPPSQRFEFAINGMTSLEKFETAHLCKCAAFGSLMDKLSQATKELGLIKLHEQG